MGPAKWSYFYLYVIIDIFSRRVVGWHIADAETAALFKPLFDDAIVKHGIVPARQGEKQSNFMRLVFKWCGREDSNFHGSPR